jgi:hypothetical protein
MLTNPDIWVAIFAGAVLLGTAAMYIRHTTELARCIDQRYPDLWDKLYLRDFYPARPNWRHARRLQMLVLFNAGSADHPDDPEFRWHLEQARWSVAVFFLSCSPRDDDRHWSDRWSRVSMT